MTKRRRRKAKFPKRLKELSPDAYVTKVIDAKQKRRILKESIKAAEKAEKQLPLLTRSLRQLIATVNPVEVIMTIAGWALFTGVSETEVRERSCLPDVQQADVELFQGLMASISLEDWGHRIAGPEVVQRAIDDLVAVRRAFATFRMTVLGKDRNEQESAAIALQERMRLHTQIVRNWSYLDRVMAVIEDLYGPLDGCLLEAVGFRATDVITIYRSLCGLREEQYSARWKRMHKVMSVPTISEAVYAYYREHPNLQDSPDVFIANIPSGVEREAVLSRLMAHSDYVITELALISVDEVAQMTGLEPDVVERVLAATCLAPIGQNEDALERLFLDGPAWAWPGLRCGDDFVIPAPQLFFSHVHQVMGRLLKDANLTKQLELRRAEFLEEELERQFRGAFPGATLLPGRTWKWQGEQYETDLIVIVDRTLIIGEAKSGVLTLKGLRGAPDRLKKHVQDLVGAPARQSGRLEAIARAAALGDIEACQVVDSLGLNVVDLDTIIRVSVTLEDFSVIASLENELKAAGWLDADVLLAPTMSIADLACVFELLEMPALILHYLRERYRLQKRFTILGDELDCLGSYVSHGLALPHGNHKAHLQIMGESAPVDQYFIGKHAGLDVPKPRRGFPPWFTSLLQCLHDRARPGWTTVALAVLSGLDAQSATGLEESMEKLRQTVPFTHTDEKHICSLVWVPAEATDDLVVYYVFAQTDHASRYERAQATAAEQMERTGRSRCIVIGRMVEGWGEPYSFFMIAGR